MTSIGSTSIPLAGVRPIATSGLPVVQLSPEQKAEFARSIVAQFRVPDGPASNAPENLYAEIRDGNGKVIASIYNSGGAATPGPIADLSNDGHGPALTQKRAEQIARALHGTLVKAPTAQTQAEFDARPPARWKIDYAAMERWLQSHLAPPDTNSGAASMWAAVRQAAEQVRGAGTDLSV